jgi:hypothetical protein
MDLKIQLPPYLYSSSKWILKYSGSSNKKGKAILVTVCEGP